MCGIVGYVGKRPVQELLLEGLRKLEYRGYDSAGISVIADGRIDAVRAVGNLSALEAKLHAPNAARADGGAAVAVAEMALAGNIGMTMTVVPQIPNPGAILFGEDQGRYVVTTRDPEQVRAIANAAQLFTVPIGMIGGDALTFDLVGRGGPQSASLSALRSAHEGFFPRLMGSELTPEF